MIQCKKQDILDLDLSDCIKLEETQLNIWADDNKLNRFESWLLPQLVSNFGRWEIVISAGKIDCLATIRRNCSDPKQQQLWKLTRIKRSKLITKQIANPRYASLTPLILAGVKQFQGIAYSSWVGLDNLHWMIEPELHSAIHCDLGNCSSLGSERLLEIRNQGLTQRSGTKAGQQKPAESTWSLTGIQDTEIGHLPKLTQSMLCQIWLAHPKHRDQLMILDPKNWDLMPEPIIPHDVFKKQEPVEQFTKSRQTIETELPWLIT
jgi:hypothetical protein